MSSTALIVNGGAPVSTAGAPFMPVPWRDPHSVPPKELAAFIQQLEQACLDNPGSADLRTYLGMAHAVNYDVDQSMVALEDARRVDPENFWAQLKYAELHYRLRVLTKAEEETRRAAELASTPMQLAIARKQMQDIRTLQHSAVRNVDWTKPLTMPALALAAMLVGVFVFMMWK